MPHVGNQPLRSIPMDEEDRFEAEHDIRTLTEARRILQSKDRLERVKKVLKDNQESLEELQGNND